MIRMKKSLLTKHYKISASPSALFLIRLHRLASISYVSVVEPKEDPILESPTGDLGSDD